MPSDLPLQLDVPDPTSIRRRPRAFGWAAGLACFGVFGIVCCLASNGGSARRLLFIVCEAGFSIADPFTRPSGTSYGPAQAEGDGWSDSADALAEALGRTRPGSRAAVSIADAEPFSSRFWSENVTSMLSAPLKAESALYAEARNPFEFRTSTHTPNFHHFAWV